MKTAVTIILLALPIIYSHAYTNDTIVDTTHTAPTDFVVTESGEMFGTTIDGMAFSQLNIVNDLTRLQRFQIADAWWYISDRGVIGYGQGLSDLQALSIYVTLM